MIYIDGFILTKCNGMSFCLRSLLQAMPFEKRKGMLVVVPKNKVAVDSIPEGFNVKIIECYSFLLWSNLVFPFYLLVNRKKVSTVFYPANTMPFLFSSFFDSYLLLHDIMFMREFSFSSMKHRLNHFYYKANLLASIRKVKKIFTVSDFSKNDILSYFKNVTSDDVIVIEESAKSFPSPITVELPADRFYLSVCLSDPRKNTVLAIEGFLSFLKMRSVIDNSSLVLFGDSKYWSQLVQRFADNAEFSKKVHFVGRVSDAQLGFLYKNAYAFLFPSTYEGFGLPVLEAMSFGTPVITSRVTSLGEVAGDAGVYIDEFSVEQVALALTKLDDKEVCDQYQKLSLRNVTRYSWDRSAEIILSTLSSNR